MAGNRLKYPPRKDIEAAVREHGSVMKAAKVLGFKWSTFRDYLSREDMIADMKRIADEVQQERSVNPADVESVSQEEILQDKVKRLERQVLETRKATKLDAAILQRFESAFDTVQPRPWSPLAISRRPSRDEGVEHALLFSDAHMNEVVSLEETMGLNAFNYDICLRRMQRIQEAVLSFQAHRPYPIKTLNIWNLGDNFSGDIHAELTATNEMAHEEAVTQFAVDTVPWYERFADHYEHVSVRGVPGNHPRRTPKPTAKQAFNNSDVTYYRFLEGMLRNHPRFDFEFKRAKFQAVTVAKRWRALLLHGDGVRSTMVDVPWGGIIRFLGKLSRQFAAAGDPIDYFGLGHYHTASQLAAGGPGTKTFVNGSVKGLDEYSLHRFGGGDPPQQLLLTFHPKRGLTEVQYLDCEDVLPLRERPLVAA